jgi:hypothetical protein
MDYLEVDAFVGQMGVVTISLGKALADQAYCYHPYCWEFVRTSAGNVAPKQLLNYAQSSMRLYNTPFKPATGQANIVEISVRSELDFKDLFIRVTSLPPELQQMILHLAGPSPASSLLDIAFFNSIALLLRAGPSLHQKTTCTIARRMTFHFVTIKGSLYWCGCESAKGMVGHRGKTITKDIPQDANILRFTIGCFGIRGLQFQGPTEESEFIGGRGKRSWTGEITSSDLRYLLLGVDVN